MNKNCRKKKWYILAHENLKQFMCKDIPLSKVLKINKKFKPEKE